MDEKRVSGSYLIVSEGKTDSFYPMYFGVSCALCALKVLTKPHKDDDKWVELCDKMLQGSAQLLGLLVWRIQREKANDGLSELLCKLETAEKEIKELKQIRREDAKANEKVVGIFASQEQSWFMERKKLRQHVGALMNEVRVLQKRKEEAICERDDKLKEIELLIQSKDKALVEEENKKKELEEKLINVENVADELRETAKREAQEYSTDLWKHKTAFLELVSNQRQLEAELGRALRQLDTKNQEIDLVLEQKEESVLLAQKLSMEVVKTRKDLEQKDKILSAMLRKSKLDTAEKQMLLKEVKLSKAKRKQAELETEGWRAISECKHERHSLRSMFARQGNLRSDDPSIARGTSQVGKGRSQPTDYVLEYENPEFRKDSEVPSPLSDFYSPEMNDELAITADVKRLEGWVHSEAEKYATSIQKRHNLEIDAFAEQMRLKDEKLEAFRWRMLSMEIELKRLQSHVEGLNQDISQLRRENMKLESLLMKRQEELNAFKMQFARQVKPQICQKTDLDSSLPDPASALEASSIQIVKREPAERDQETKADLVEMCQENDAEREQALAINNQSKSVVFNVQSPEKEFEEEKDHTSLKDKRVSLVEVGVVEKLPSPRQPLTKANSSPLRMDLQALGVSYKIKRLKQQLIMLERLTGKQESEEDAENNEDAQNEIKGFQLLLSLLNKQIGRYQSLQSKTDELCKRMHDNDVDKTRGDSSTLKTKGETKTLEHFLEETFQLQRYMVATGQKLMEVQSKISSELVGVPEELDKSVSFDTKRFADNIRTLFQEVQRGLEVRISRIIGDLEGTLACQGMIRLRK
ncbi:COP1-interactive protein 1 [Ricinus communis]|uniref:COP1-interactive protein 1 n=1 Tax=Ricinus communis TaxID=3988 RepID=UPI00201A7E97|nr:COP1-interactive protein 1 [Ricinus communis]XP_048236125.1 COP1-interactive protein 1 [Ricinus communis]XP_048236127.1 COP1-interactive protein 1 [Ricinus communis]